MSTITFTKHLSSQSLLSANQQSIKKRLHSEESNLLRPKKIKRSIDVTLHWKKLQTIYESNTTKVFECKSKNDYLIISDPLGNRSCFIVSKSSYYWLTESIRLMQQHVEYGTIFDAAMIGEVIEIERNLKALKLNIEKNGIEKTFFFRAEALLNFIRLCCTIFENPSEKYRRRLHALFNLCANCWLHMFDIMLPMSIVRAEKSFIFDDDYGDFENDSILRHFRKDDQKKIKKVNIDLPNIRHILYSILLLIEKFNEIQLIDQIYVERFEMIYQIWILIDNEINLREDNHMTNISKKIIKNKSENSTQKLPWNFINECSKYEKIFGTFTNNMK
ncbi:unnamed protein product [Adineta steineri]|uniref:Uncharacterized protein n=1 Tax=Adineta steineri TaxID=433720 RepID=A0A814DW85_9BILA|nr:unnamed protein product [Adineta steineri]